MGGGGVAFVGVPTVLGIRLVQAQHVFIPMGLGQHTRCSDRHVSRISVHYRCGRYLQQLAFRHVGLPFIAVHKYVLRPNAQLVQGPLHAQDGALQDIAFIDLLGTHFHDCPADRFAFDDGTQGFALVLGELLGVIEPGELRYLLNPLGIQDHRRAEHTAC